MKYYISPPPMNPVSRLVAAIVAVLVLAVAFFLGLAVLIILAAVLASFVLFFYLRSWWLGRTSGDSNAVQKRPNPDGKVIDAEYTVVSRRRN
jgi:hypothetical protein